MARDFDLTETRCRAGVHQAKPTPGERPGLTSEEREGASPGYAGENRRLRGHVEVLSDATAFFAKETR